MVLIFYINSKKKHRIIPPFFVTIIHCYHSKKEKMEQYFLFFVKTVKDNKKNIIHNNKNKKRKMTTSQTNDRYIVLVYEDRPSVVQSAERPADLLKACFLCDTYQEARALKMKHRLDPRYQGNVYIVICGEDDKNEEESLIYHDVHIDPDQPSSVESEDQNIQSTHTIENVVPVVSPTYVRKSKKRKTLSNQQ